MKHRTSAAALLTGGLNRCMFEHASTPTAYQDDTLHPQLTDYRLPDGRIVPIREDVARGAREISFQLENGSIVTARICQ